MTSNQGNPGEVRITVAEKFKNFEREITRNPGSGSSPKAQLLIQRVPPVLSSIKVDFKKYFEPRLVALGPLHHGNAEFERAEQTKLKLAFRFADENGTTGEALFTKIKAKIEDLKNCYNPEDIKNYNEDELAWIFVVDGCAVLYAVHFGLQGKFDKLDTKADLLVFAQLDLFLLENQIPYQVLKILISSTKEPIKWEESITQFIDDNLITNIQSGQQKSQHTGDQRNRQDYAHLLERFRSKLLTGLGEESSSSMIGKMLLRCGDNRKDRKRFRSIKELKESGIHVRPGKSNNLKNISFYCNLLGSLKMPRLLVDDSTASKFMNLVALEMCRDFENDFAVTSYLCFLDSLIDTAEDVKELRVTGMLHNYLGSDEEVADLFNKMSRDLVPDQGMYHDVTEYIHKYCNNPWTTTVAKAYYTHFSTPWTVLVFLGAIIYLILSAIQAYSSLFPQNNRSD